VVETWLVMVPVAKMRIFVKNKEKPSVNHGFTFIQDYIIFHFSVSIIKNSDSQFHSES